MLIRLLMLLLLAAPVLAQEAGEDVEKKEDAKEWEVATADLGPTTTIEYEVEEATWMSVDVSPDGATLVFDILGDIFTMPIAGGEATLLRGGRAYEVQPRYSPDGQWISFTSDAGGGDNIWVMRADGSDARQITKEDFRLLNNARWSPDGRFVVARKHFTSRRSLGAGEMWLYDVQFGGSGIQLTEKPTDQKDVGEPVFSPDGRYLYYSLDATPGEFFEYSKDPNGRIYAIRRLDLREGDTETLISQPGGAVRPEPSHDGRSLAYVRRVRNDSVLMLRDLASGDERMLFDGLSKDSQETWSVFGVYPGFAWTPDDRSIVVWAKGKLVRVDVATGEAYRIPFRAKLRHEVVDALRFHPDVASDQFDVRVIRWPVVSPDGKWIVFQALGHLWVREREGGVAKRVSNGKDFEFHPAWSPDSKQIVFTTWNDVEGGQVVRSKRDGGDRKVVVAQPGHYVEPAFSADGKQIVYRRAGGDGYRGERFAQETGIHVVSSEGGTPRLVTESGSQPRFVEGDQRIQLFEGGRTKKVYTVDLLGGDRRELVSSERAMEIAISPDGRWVAFEELWEIYVAPLADAGQAVAIGPNMKNLPARKVSEIAGEYLSWSADSRTLRFGLGPQLFEVDVAAQFVERGEDEEQPQPTVVELGWKARADIPRGDLLFTNATVFTMSGDEVLENTNVLVRGNRIVAVGADANAAGARVIDLEGRVLMPGYVDVHAHMGSSNNGMHARSNWAYNANLAFGVTTTHDPSNNTGMVFASSELVRAGEVLGPRIFSTGTILYGAEGDFKAVIEKPEDAERHLKRLKAYGAWSAKSYNQPRRNQRQYVIAKARELEMNIVPEGGSMYGHNMSMILDGHTTIEHAVPLAPLYEDALELFARSRTAYTPTLVVGYGGLWGENYWYQKTNVWEDERLLRFVPRDVVDPRSRRRTMVPDEEFHHIELAKSAAEIVHRGGLADIGAHGQMQGVGVHWELWMFEQGGLTPMEVLQVGTIFGARAIGLDHELGTVEVGKLADLIVLDGDPRQDIRHTRDVRYVMINGRLFDAADLTQLHPERRPLPEGPQLETIPASALGAIECHAWSSP